MEYIWSNQLFLVDFNQVFDYAHLCQTLVSVELISLTSKICIWKKNKWSENPKLRNFHAVLNCANSYAAKKVSRRQNVEDWNKICNWTN